MDQQPDAYIHGTTPEEQRRLALMNTLINDACLRELGLAGGERVLDVGSGTAQFTRAIAQAAGPSGYVLGIERDADQRAEAQRQMAEAGDPLPLALRQGEADALPLLRDEWGSFDVVHARFLLEHVAEPIRVVRQMVHAARPGGRLVLCDDDHEILRLWPEPPGVLPLWQAYCRVYDRLGNDPFVGRRLVTLLHQAGAHPRRNTSIFYGSCSGDARFADFVANLIGVLEGARDVLLAHALFDASYFEEVLAGFRAWSRRPDAALWYAICWAEGVRET